ncbi:MAG: YaiI/YqxD family protein [Acidobacteriota bacterium]
MTSDGTDVATPTIFIDADGCPVKEEVYRVARRHDLRVKVVANRWMRRPDRDEIEMVVVGDRFDAADDWIVERVAKNDIVVSADIPLASRCLARGAHVLGHAGRAFDEDNIGEALASRELMSQLRDLGTVTGGPAPFSRKDRSRFLERLDETIRTIRRNG